MQSPVVRLTREVSNLGKRNIGVFAPCWQKVSDPIQQLFLDKIREYKSKSAGGKLVEPSPELEKEIKSDKERVLRQLGIQAGEDLTKFPAMTFKDQPLENPN